MIGHIVLFKLKDSSDEEREKVRELLNGMVGKVPSIRRLEVGVDFLGSPRSYDIALTVYADDSDALAAYQNDPYHCAVVKAYMHAATVSSVSCDYELSAE